MRRLDRTLAAADDTSGIRSRCDFIENSISESMEVPEADLGGKSSIQLPQTHDKMDDLRRQRRQLRSTDTAMRQRLSNQIRREVRTKGIIYRHERITTILGEFRGLGRISGVKIARKKA